MTMTATDLVDLTRRRKSVYVVHEATSKMKQRINPFKPAAWVGGFRFHTVMRILPYLKVYVPKRKR